MVDRFGSAYEPLKLCAKLCVTESMLLTRKAVHHFLHSLKRVCDIELSESEGFLLKEGEISHWELPSLLTYVLAELSFYCFESVLIEFL